MKKILLGSLILAGFLYAETAIEITNEDIAQQQQMNVPVKAEKKENMRQWLGKVRRQYKKPGVKIFTTTVTVKGLDTDPQFGDFVNNAFERAFLDVRAQQILDKAREVASTEMLDQFSTNIDDSMKEQKLKEKAVGDLNKQKNQAAAELNQARSQMRDKLNNEKLSFDSIGAFMESLLKDVSDEEIDAALKKQGITNVANLSKAEKMNTFKDNYAKELFRRGSGEIEGLIPIQTKLIKNDKGTYELGLVAIISPKTLQVARDLRNKVPTRIKKDGACKTLEEQIPIDDLATIYELIGPRLYYNENCEPVIVSYGRGNFIPTNDDIRNKSLSNIAEKQADLRADGYITNFIYSKVNTQTKDKTEEIDMTNALLNAKIEVNLDDGKPVEAEEVGSDGLENETVRKSVNYFSNKISASSKETLNGVEEFGAWDTLDEPYEEYPRVVGVVKYYSSSQIVQSKDFYKELNKGVKAPGASKPKPKGGAKSIESYNNNTPDDF